jgi:phosphoglycolate phosphatase
MLQALREAGVKTAVISNKADFAVQELAVHYFNGLFDFALGERAEITRKPAPDMVYYTLKQLGESADGAVYIGDSDVDILTAKNAGLPAIGVCWGFRDRACLLEAGATDLADTVAELQGLILKD